MAAECPNRDDLIAFHAGQLSLAMIDRIGDHLGECSSCESILDSVYDRSDTVVSQLRLAATQSTNVLVDWHAEPEFHEFDAFAKLIAVAGVTTT